MRLIVMILVGDNRDAKNFELEKEQDDGRFYLRSFSALKNVIDSM
jgi:hypothetical protein